MALDAEEMRQAVRGSRKACALCGAGITYAGRGRPRRLCETCRPPGGPKPTKAHREFRRTFGDNTRAAYERERARGQARYAAMRRLTRACPDLFACFLADELEKRGVGSRGVGGADHREASGSPGAAIPPTPRPSREAR